MAIKNQKYNEENLSQLVKQSRSFAQVIQALGLKMTGGNYRHVKHYIKFYDLDTSHFTGQGWNSGDSKIVTRTAQPLEEILVEKSTYTNTASLHRRLVSQGLLQNCCQICNLTNWLGRPLTLHLDHINGNHIDNRIENLRILCPNCHAQTETYSNKKRI